MEVVDQDTAGPLARTVADAAVLLGALAGPDPRDPAAAAPPGGLLDYTRFLDPEGLRGARLGVARRFFGQELFLQAQARGPLTEPAYRKALGDIRRISAERGIDAAVAEHRLDAIVAPTMGPACLTDLLLGDRWVGGSAWVAAAAGYPAISVPAGSFRELPVGISFFGRAWSEPALIRIAFAFERAAGRRRPPRFLSTAPTA